MFLHAVSEGPANRSYGLQVAQLAGVPRAVIARARDYLAELESTPRRRRAPAAGATRSGQGELPLFARPRARQRTGGAARADRPGRAHAAARRSPCCSSSKAENKRRSSRLRDGGFPTCETAGPWHWPHCCCPWRAAANPTNPRRQRRASTTCRWRRRASPTGRTARCCSTASAAFHRTVTTSSPEAQKYFDQGMRLLWAFNHDESTRSFAQAAELDPACAMCFWGVALTVGPNYNLPVMAEPRAKVAWEALQTAQASAPQATPVEQALIAALGKRYTGPQPLDPSNSGSVLDGLRRRDARRRAAVSRRPRRAGAVRRGADGHQRVEAVDRRRQGGARHRRRSSRRSKAVLEKDPTHPGANHYYIHTMEASPHPEQARRRRPSASAA